MLSSPRVLQYDKTAEQITPRQDCMYPVGVHFISVLILLLVGN